MKEIELKNCPNCKQRIGKHDVECPYCKYIDDPKYKKYNSKLKKKTNTKRNNKNDIYKIILIMPILMYLTSFMLDINKYLVLSLLLLNILCLFIKKKYVLLAIIIEIISMSYNFITNIISSIDNVKNEIIILLLGLIFIIIPKIIYCFKTKKRKNKKRRSFEEKNSRKSNWSNIKDYL